MKDQAHSVINPLVVAEGVMTTFMGNYPNSSKGTTLEDPVHWPHQVVERSWELMEVSGGNVVKDRDQCEVIDDIGE
jgi:hypothetical protein